MFFLKAAVILKDLYCIFRICIYHNLIENLSNYFINLNQNIYFIKQ